MTRSASPILPLPLPTKLLVVLFILTIALANVIPGYLGGRWPWQQVPDIRQVEQLKAIQTAGLSLPGWQILEQEKVELGGHKWSVQAMVPTATAKTATLQDAVWLLLRPQTWNKDMPQVDWMDINGAQQWTEDSRRQIQFDLRMPEVEPFQVRARFLRGWSQKRTNAVLQWYAWSKGGHPAPSHWFWADQWAQLRQRQRLAWVAVSIQMPIKPLGEIETAQTEMESLGRLVQSALMATALQ
ncbi:MAG: cyanoexosortase B system-associated protein [Elainella sp.]